VHSAVTSANRRKPGVRKSRSALSSRTDQRSYWCNRVRDVAFEQVEEAADLGGAIHAALELAMIGEPFDPAMAVYVDPVVAYRAVVEAAGAVRYAKQSEYGRLVLKYTVLRGISVFGPDTSEEDLLRCLLAPEGLVLSNAENCKKAIKERAVALARIKLRAEGKSFVVKDGVNPLVVMVQPVVAALNAQECTGLETALRELGSTARDIDRKPMHDLVVSWQPKMMSGEMGPSEVNLVLGKIAVALGPDAYNRFVDAYNNGTAGAK